MVVAPPPSFNAVSVWTLYWMEMLFPRNIQLELSEKFILFLFTLWYRCFYIYMCAVWYSSAAYYLCSVIAFADYAAVVVVARISHHARFIIALKVNFAWVLGKFAIFGLNMESYALIGLVIMIVRCTNANFFQLFFFIYQDQKSLEQKPWT